MTAYATFEEFENLGLIASAIDDCSQVEAAILSASRFADSLIGTRYPGPLETWPESLTNAVCKIAAFEYMATRGYQPEGPDEIILIRRNQAVDWLKMIGRGQAVLVGVGAKAPTPAAPTAARVSSDEQRGW